MKNGEDDESTLDRVHDATARARELAAYIEGQADASGKFEALEAKTKPDASSPPSASTKQGFILRLLNMLPPWGRVLVVVLIIGMLAWKGGEWMRFWP